MFCINCGTQLPDDAMFCSNCGQKIEAVTKTPSGTLAAPPKKHQGHWEYAEFTHHENEPFAVINDKDGIAVLFFHLDNIKFSLELEHQRDGWQLAEKPSITTLMDENRFDMTIEPYGRFSRFTNAKKWTIRSTTLKFKRWVE